MESHKIRVAARLPPMVAGHTTVYCECEIDSIQALDRPTIDEAVLGAVKGEPQGMAFTRHLVLYSHDHVLRRVKLYMGDALDTSAGTMGEPVTQPAYVRILTAKLTRTLALQCMQRFDVPYSQEWKIARGVAQFLWAFTALREQPDEDVKDPAAPRAEDQEIESGTIRVERVVWSQN